MVENGAKCLGEGQDAVKKMKALLTSAEQALTTAQQQLTAALAAPVSFASVKFDSLTKGKCEFAFNSEAWKSAESAATNAKAKVSEAQGGVPSAKAAVDASEVAAKEAVRKCQCKAYQDSVTAEQNANGKFAKDQADTWTKAANLECVLTGKGATDCKVPPLPVVKAPPLAAGIDEWSCKTRPPTGYPTPYPTPNPTPNPTTYTGNNYYNRGTGGWGGVCTCPNGQAYPVADNNDSCGSLACVGGTSGLCNRYDGPWSRMAVNCGKFTRL